ncbi:MAG: DUF1338 family protein [Gammaproteobacteria bacterium]
MNIPATSTLERLLIQWSDELTARALLGQVAVPEALRAERGEIVPRAVIAQALNLALFHGLLARVPAARERVGEVTRAGRRVQFDHGALRTVISAGGALPSGYRAFSRILEPLGYRVANTYPLPRIHMTGRAYCHEDLPEEIAQFFVSEIALDGFSEDFQAAAARVVATVRDLLSSGAADLLERLAHTGALQFREAAALLPALVLCFDRPYAAPALADYRTLLRESAEMAWIATEGNLFNHVTERVSDIVAVAEEQKRHGRPMKEAIEVSRSGRVRQTAYFAASIAREFVAPDGPIVTQNVPGSFYEFIQRERFTDESGKSRLDLAFDSSNAQGIFKMTTAA